MCQFIVHTFFHPLSFLFLFLPPPPSPPFPYTTLFRSPNIETAAQLQEVTGAVQNQQQAAGREWPAIISVDQEGGRVARSEEHTSELQSRGQLVCRLLLEKKNKIYIPIYNK